MRGKDNARSGGEILIDQLSIHGVRDVFCVPGESYLAALDAFYDSEIKLTVCRHESTAATMHRQPTPGSIAAAESKLGDVSSQKVEAVEAAMARAREADHAGDQSGCEQALVDVQRALGP